MSHMDSYRAPPSAAIEEFVDRQLAFYESEYTETTPLKVALLTFNVGCKKPPNNAYVFLPVASCRERTPPDKAACFPDRSDPDLIVISLQEVDMSPAAMIREETEAALPWVDCMRECIGAGYDPDGNKEPYYPIVEKQMVGLMALVYARKSCLRMLHSVEVGTVATGAMGTMGNKGAVAVRIGVRLTSMCFIIAHLAAGQGGVHKRNEDIATILSTLSFSPVDPRRCPYVPEEDALVSSDPLPFADTALLTPKDHNLVFVLGDLNYRVDMTYERARDLALNKNIPELLKEDQLVREMKQDHSPWEGYTDFIPTFPPTYRFDVGTENVYDTSEKKRIPAFTDRILFKSSDETHRNVSLHFLNCFPNVISSDHKPVLALVTVPVKHASEDKKQRKKASLMQTLARLGYDHVAVAQTNCSSSKLEFGPLSYYKSAGRGRFTITNEGDCVAEFTASRHVDKNMDITEGLWLHIAPLTGAIFPKKSVEITVEAVFKKPSLKWMYKYPPFSEKSFASIRSLLLISVRDGPTHCIECSAELQPSVFGNTLDNIIRLQSVPCSTAYAVSLADEPPPSGRPLIPKELWYLCDAIEKRGKYTKELFVERGMEEEMYAVMKHLDNNDAPIPTEIASPHSVAQCLLVFLRDLRDPVIPFSCYNGALQAGQAGGKAPYNFVTSTLPVIQRNIFVYLMALLRRLLLPAFAQENELSAELLAQIFSRVLLQKNTARAASSGTAVSTGKDGPSFSQLRESVMKAQLQATGFVESFLTM